MHSNVSSIERNIAAPQKVLMPTFLDIDQIIFLAKGFTHRALPFAECVMIYMLYSGNWKALDASAALRLKKIFII